MKKYKIVIEETRRKEIGVAAKTPGLAVCQAEEEYNEGKHVLCDRHFVGADIALSESDTEVKEALRNPKFLDFIKQRFENMQDLIPIQDKVRLTFGSMDNALYEFKEEETERQRAATPRIFLLYRCDAWHSVASKELIASFTSFEQVMAYMRGNQLKFRLLNREVEEFELHGQTQDREENYCCEEILANPVPTPCTTQSKKDRRFYDCEFSYGKSSITRGELEEMASPFCTENVSDEQMNQIVWDTETGTRERLRLALNEDIDFENERHREVWWEELEAAVNRQNVPYYEDFIDVLHGTTDPEVEFCTRDNDAVIYFTDDRETAKKFAYAQDCGGLGLDELPIIIHATILLRNPYYIHTEEEWAKLGDISVIDKSKFHGYDGIIFRKDDSDATCYVLFDAANCKITEREILE